MASKPNKNDLIVDLQRQILTQRLRPGRELDETEQAQRFGLSRTPTREAFRDLAGQGFLEIVPGRYTRVSELTPDTLREFFQTAPLIYSSILRLAAMAGSGASGSGLTGLKNAQAAFEASLADGDAAQRALANHEFHLAIAGLANNRYLMPTFQRLLIDHTRIAMTFYSGANTDAEKHTAARHHREMITAIERQDPDRAARLAIEHWDLSKDQLIQFAVPAPLSQTEGSL